MKLYSDKDKKFHPDFREEFADEFFEIENDLLRTEIAGGSITRRISEAYDDDMSILENFPI
jgi:hypothetical protein